MPWLFPWCKELIPELLEQSPLWGRGWEVTAKGHPGSSPALKHAFLGETSGVSRGWGSV